MSKKTSRTIYLSRSERRTGGRFYLRFTAMNGLSITFLGESTVMLLAMHFGARNIELGFISGMMHISGIILLIIPHLFRNKNIVTVGFWAWMIRGLTCVPYIALFYIEGQNAVILIMILYALFCVSRTTGIAMVTTVLKRLLSNRTLGEGIFRADSSFQSTQIISRLVSYGILSLKFLANLNGLLILQGLGLISNTLSALSFRKIPNRTRVEYKKGKNLFVILAESIRNPQHRYILFLRWIALGQLILFSMSIPLLRRSAGFSSASIFLFTISLSLAALLSSLSLRPIVKRAGSRPILIFVTIPAAILFFCWAILPASLSSELFIIFGFSTMFFINSSHLAVNQMLMSITPDDSAVGFNSMETFVTALLAIILAFSAGYLADLSQTVSAILPINDFGLVFVPACIGSITQSLLALKISEPGSMSLKVAARIITRVDNLKMWQTIANLETTANPVKRKTLIHTMGHSNAPVASSEIIKILSEPLSVEKGDLIETLFFTPRPELLEFLCEEALNKESFYRDKAVFALGAYSGDRSISALETLLNDDDEYIQSIAAKSLGRLRSTKHLGAIQQQWKKSRSIQERLNYMIGLFPLDPNRLYIDDLFSQKIIDTGERSQQTYFTLLSQQFGMIPPLGILYRDEAMGYGKGLELLLEESRDTRFLLDHGDELALLWREGQYKRIWDLNKEFLDGLNPPAILLPLIRGLQGFPTERGDAANSLAGLYFSYQISTAEDVIK